jgi:hypothetical protein
MDANEGKPAHPHTVAELEEMLAKAKAEQPAEEKKLTPAQLAEIEERNKPFIDRFKDVVDEAALRLKHGTSLTQTFVDALRGLYQEMLAPGDKVEQHHG